LADIFLRHSEGRRTKWTEKDAPSAIVVAMDLLENPDEWWSVLRQRLAANDVARQSTGMSVDIAAVDSPAATRRVLA